MYGFHSVANPSAWGYSPLDIVGGGAIAAVGGPSTWGAVVYWDRLGEEDIPDFRGLPWWETDGWIDDDGSLFSGKLYRLREGIERFFITDINNPAGSAQGQSTLVVMWDAFAREDNYDRYDGPGEGQGATVLFNHLPGGMNVLYMDGHVEFVKYSPAGRPPLDAPPVAGSVIYPDGASNQPGRVFSMWSHEYGGHG
jgi:prepilin-type processing-associated H-X9-DG protein